LKFAPSNDYLNNESSENSVFVPLCDQIYYDQIAIKTWDGDLLDYINDPTANNVGVVELFDSVLTDNSYKSYKAHMKKTT